MLRVSVHVCCVTVCGSHTCVYYIEHGDTKFARQLKRVAPKEYTLRTSH